jgi:hypothetical protein
MDSGDAGPQNQPARLVTGIQGDTSNVKCK